MHVHILGNTEVKWREPYPCFEIQAEVGATTIVRTFMGPFIDPMKYGTDGGNTDVPGGEKSVGHILVLLKILEDIPTNPPVFLIF